MINLCIHTWGVGCKLSQKREKIISLETKRVWWYSRVPKEESGGQAAVRSRIMKDWPKKKKKKHRRDKTLKTILKFTLKKHMSKEKYCAFIYLKSNCNFLISPLQQALKK